METMKSSIECLVELETKELVDLVNKKDEEIRVMDEKIQKLNHDLEMSNMIFELMEQIKSLKSKICCVKIVLSMDMDSKMKISALNSIINSNSN